MLEGFFCLLEPLTSVFFYLLEPITQGFFRAFNERFFLSLSSKNTNLLLVFDSNHNACEMFHKPIYY